jgi:hypothetical protein
VKKKRTMGSDLHGWRLGWVWREQNLIFMEGCMFVIGGGGLDDFQLLLSRDVDHRSAWIQHFVRTIFTGVMSERFFVESILSSQCGKRLQL